MNIVVVGPGAIGSLFALRLARAGHTPVLLDHDRARAESLLRAGFRLEGDSTARTVLPVTADPATLAPADLVFLCVKAFDTAAAIRAVLTAIAPGGTVVSLQNGAGNAESIASVVDPGHVVCATTTEGASLAGPGCVRHGGAGLTRLAPWRRTEIGRAAFVCDVLTPAGFRAETAPDADSLLWGKLIISSGINPLTAIHDVRNGELLERTLLREALRATARETDRIARACGVDPGCDDPAECAETVCRNTASNVSSMLQDVRRGRRTEIDAVNGYVIRCAEAHAIPAPLNTELTARVRSLEAKKDAI